MNQKTKLSLLIEDDAFIQNEIFAENKKLEEIINLKPELSSKEIQKVIFAYFSFISSIDEERIKKFEELIEIYDDMLTDEGKFNVLCYLKSDINFESYLQKHFKLFQSNLKNTVFIPSSYISETDTLDDFEWQLDMNYPNDDYKLKVNTFGDKNLRIMYQYFFNEMKFLNQNKQITNYDISFLYKLSFQELLKFFYHELEEENIDSKNISPLIEVFEKTKNYSGEKNILTPLFQKLSPFLEKKLNKLLIIFRENFNNSMNNGFICQLCSEIISNSSFFKQKFSLEKIDHVISLPFLILIQQLQKLSTEERKNNLLYLKCFQVFLKDFLIEYDDKVETKELKRIEIIFQRMIQRGNIEVLKIQNNKSLCHYFKTNELVLNIPYSLEFLENYNAKQYLELSQIYKSKLNIFHDCDINSSYNTDQRIKIIYLNEYLGYSLTKKIIQEFSYDMNIIFQNLQNKPKHYIDKISKLLLDALRLKNQKKDYKFERFFLYFETFYNQGYSEITFTKIVKAMDSVLYALFPNNYHISKNLMKLNFVAKGDPLLEKVEAIKLYNDYRFRILSSIPDVSGKINECNFEMVDLQSPKILSNGIGKYLLPNNIKCSSCLTPNGRASSSLKHGAINPNGRFFKVTFQNKIIAYSWVWRCGDVLCFDNIEVTEDLLIVPEYESILYSCYHKAATMIMNITKQNEKSGINLVIIGRNKIDIKNSRIDQLPKVNDYIDQLFKPNHSENLYLKDSSTTQVILAGEYHSNLKTEDVEPIYYRPRKRKIRFNEIEKDYLQEKMNSIYFDYCLCNNQKYTPVKNNYVDGYLNEDWYVGLKANGQYDFYYCGIDKRLFSEVKQIIGQEKIQTQKKFNIITPDKDRIKSILNPKNIEFDLEKITNYLNCSSLESFTLDKSEYTHTTANMQTFSQILADNAITSARYGNREIGCNNGSDFISVAQVYSTAYYCYVNSFPSFLLTNNICAFQIQNCAEFTSFFKNCSYPFRDGMSGEYQVFQSISLDRTKGILIPQDDIMQLIQIIHLKDLWDLKIPLISLKDSKVIDEEEIKKYSKIKTNVCK